MNAKERKNYILLISNEHASVREKMKNNVTDFENALDLGLLLGAERSAIMLGLNVLYADLKELREAAWDHIKREVTP